MKCTVFARSNLLWLCVLPFNLNVSCFLFVKSRVAARLIAVHILYVVFRASCLKLTAGFLSAVLQLCALSMVVRCTSVVSALAVAVRSSSAFVMLSSTK